MIPDIATFAFPLHRARLYTVEDLFDGHDPEDLDGYEKTLDYRIYL